MRVQRYLSVVLLGAVLVTLSHAHCCKPDQYENQRWAVEEVISKGKRLIVESMASISYDYTNRRTVMSLNMSFSDGGYQSKSIMKNNTSYSIDLVKKTCQAFTVPAMNRSCIPDDATETGTRNMGIGSASFLATSYKYLDGDFMEFVTVTDKCTYVTEVAYGGSTDEYAMVAVEYFNTTLGIKDPSVFDLPPYCKSSTLNVNRVIKGGHKFRSRYNPFSGI